MTKKTSFDAKTYHPTAHLPNPDYLATLADLMESKGLSELEWQDNDFSFRLSRGMGQTNYIQAPAQAINTGSAITGETRSTATTTTNVTGPVPAAGFILPSPMVGSVYLSAQPGAPKFAEIGQAVKEGQTLLIIEAMKVMNQIQAPKSGILTSVLVEDGQPVEYAQHLLTIE